MNRWTELGDGEFTRILRDGREAKVFLQGLLMRSSVDGQMVDNVFFDAREAMLAIDKWEAGDEPLTFHPTDKRWVTGAMGGYCRESRWITLTVTKEACGSWKISQDASRCFDTAEAARRHADERFP